MSSQSPSVLEIDRKLRDDFRRRVKDFGVTTETTDPLLAVLFRTIAQQIDQVYGDTAQLRQSLLHELMNGLHLHTFQARPAQAVVRLINELPEPRTLRAGTELNAVASSGERLLFSLDAALEVSRARVAFALSYQDQNLRLLSGVEMSEAVQALRPSLDPVPVNLGPQPALFLAVEGVPASLLNRHGMFFELGPGSYAIEHALSHEPWWLFGTEGELTGDGLLRPRQRGGVWRLEFQGVDPEVASRQEGTVRQEPGAPELPEGFYGGRQFVFPPMEAGQPFVCRAPRLLDPVLSRIVQRDAGALLATDRVWIKIPMPPGVPALHHAVNGILLHTMTASNVFVRNQTLQFARDGVSVPVTRENGTPEHLVAPLTVMSTENEPYLTGHRPGANAAMGRYELANGRLTVHPGIYADGTPHEAANVRLWLTNGALGNRVGPGDLTGFANAAALAGVRLAPVTAASGGTDGEQAASEERRFAEALRTRGRLVTQADLEGAALAMDRRIVAAQARSGLQRRSGALRRVEMLQLTLDSHGFTQPELELRVLQGQVEKTLGARLVQGVALEVSFVWN